MRNLPSIWDGDEGRIYQFRFRDELSLSDLSCMAVEFYIYDRDGTFLAKRAGTPIAPKASGVVNLMLHGRETDWDGAGRTLILRPKVYLAIAPDGSPAVNLLANASFDSASGSLPDRIATGWTMIGTRTATWDNYRWDPYPPAIYGTFQLVNHAGLSDPDYIQQVVDEEFLPGDTLSVGCWHRIHGNVGDAAGEAKNDNHAIFYRLGAQANSYVQFEIGSSDWYFSRGSVIAATAETQVVMGLDGRGTTSSNRYDEAFCFKGAWHTPSIEAKRIVVKSRGRVSRGVGVNQIAGVGGFEYDSDLDGVADGWTREGAVNTLSMETIPANVSQGHRSQKVELGNAAVDLLRLVHRGKFLWGETWQVSVKVKTNGLLSGSGGGSGFGMLLQTQYFDAWNDGSFVVSDAVTFAPDLPTFTEYSTLITMPEDRKELMIIIFLCGYEGTVWLDDVQLTQV